MWEICFPLADGVGGVGVWITIPKFIRGGFWVYMGVSNHPDETKTHFTLQSRKSGMVIKGW